MDALEANVFLSRLRLLDPRFGFDVPADPEKAAEWAVAAAETWAAALADVGLEDALEAAVAHYRETRDRLMPVDVVRRCRSVVPLDREAALLRSKWLAVRGVSEAQFARMTRAQVEALVYGGQVEGR